MVEVELTNDTIRAGRATALTAIPGSVRIRARRNHFTFRDSLLSCAGYADQQALTRTTSWEGRDNRYHGSGTWLQLDGRATHIRGLAAWRGLWGAEPGSWADNTQRPLTVGASARLANK